MKRHGGHKMIIWRNLYGGKYRIPAKCCMTCDFCTDIFIDPWFNYRIYAVSCFVNQEYAEDGYMGFCKYWRKLTDGYSKGLEIY